MRARAARAGAGGTLLLNGDYGLLHAVDERLAAYGFETNTGARFVVIVDMRGRRIDGSVTGLVDKERRAGAAAVGLRDGEMKPVSWSCRCHATSLARRSLFSFLSHPHLCKIPM